MSVKKMSQNSIYTFLQKNDDKAFTLSSIQKKFNSDITKKVIQLVKYGIIQYRNGIVDYPKKHNVAVKYYYVGQPKEYIPEPKVLL